MKAPSLAEVVALQLPDPRGFVAEISPASAECPLQNQPQRLALVWERDRGFGRLELARHSVTFERHLGQRARRHRVPDAMDGLDACFSQRIAVADERSRPNPTELGTNHGVDGG
ncbi:hypothetical protein GCM10027597_27920 [Saccharopolyspora tripterygii]